jgi:hypothetical protein
MPPSRRADERLLVGSETADDAAVCRLTDEWKRWLSVQVRESNAREVAWRGR